MYPVAYRTAVAIALGGVRGSPGGVVGFAAGAALTAAYLAWQLSKDKPYNPPLHDRWQGRRKSSNIEVRPEHYEAYKAALRELRIKLGSARADRLWAEEFQNAASEDFRPIPNPALHGWSMEIDCAPSAPGGGAPTGNWAIFTGHQHTCWVQQAGIWNPWNPASVDPDIVQDFHSEWLNGFPHRGWTYKIYSHEATGNADLLNEPTVDAVPHTVLPSKAEQKPPPYSFAGSPGASRGYTDVIPLRRAQEKRIRLAAGVNLKAILNRPAVRARPVANVVEVKLHIRMFGLPIGVEFLGALFEALDLIDAIFRGLPTGGLGHMNSIQKLAFIIDNIDQIDWQVVARVIEDQMEDFAIGIQGRILGRMGAAAGLPFGLGTIAGAANQ